MEIYDFLIKPLLVVFVFAGLFWANNWVFTHIDFLSSKGKQSLYRGIVGIFFVLLGIVIFILSLPISQNAQSQILSLLGIVISAGIALSSTTLLGNLLAGFMNNSANRFKSGDLIEIENLKGRVTKKSFFYTEIQLEDSNFTTIPNIYLATKPLKNTRKSDTVISTEVSLGYDISRKIIESALIEGATKTGLTEPYVYVTSLGDFSVVYRISGFLEDTDTYFSTSYALNKYIMDALHKRDIEIISPSFMNQRQLSKDDIFISKPQIQIDEKQKTHEDQIFDKAKTFEKLESSKEKLQKELEETKDKEEISKIKEKIHKIENAKEKAEEKINEEK